MKDIINLPVWGIWGFWMGGLVLLFILHGDWVQRMRWRWGLGFGGGLLVLMSFFFGCWVRLDFPEYLVSFPDMIELLIPGALVQIILEAMGVEWGSQLVSLLDGISLNGATILILPTLSTTTRVFCLIPLALAAGTFICAPFAAFRPGEKIFKVFGGILAALCLISIVGILTSLPELRGLGSQGKFLWMLLATLLNTSLGEAPWFTIFGLSLLMIDGFLETMEHQISENPLSNSDSMIDEELWSQL